MTELAEFEYMVEKREELIRELPCTAPKVVLQSIEEGHAMIDRLAAVRREIAAQLYRVRSLSLDSDSVQSE